MNEIWILGASGRSGRAIAAELAAKQMATVLVGRDASRLRELAETIGGESRIVTADSVKSMVAELARSRLCQLYARVLQGVTIWIFPTSSPQSPTCSIYTMKLSHPTVAS